MRKSYAASIDIWSSGACAAFGIITVLWCTRPILVHQNLNDDSYITLTYAKNLAAGSGFVYNHAPATLGTTTPLFTLLCAVGARLMPVWDVADVAILSSIAAWLMAAGLLFVCLRQVGMAILPAAIAAVIQLLLVRTWQPFIGMEIWLFQFLLLLTLYLWLVEKPLAAGICVALLALTRGEGALLGLILGVLYLMEGRKPLLRFVSGGLLISVLWVAYALPVFGTVIPNTLAAKQAQAHLPSARAFLERIPTDLLNYVSTFGIEAWGLTHPWLNVVWLLVILGVWQMGRRYPKLLLLPVWALIYLAAYALINPNAYVWYVLHLVFVVHVVCGVALAALVEWQGALRGGQRWSALGVIVVLAALFLYTDLTYAVTQAPHYAGDSRADAYRALTDWLRTNTSAQESVAYIEIGYLGYFSQNRIVDLAGLVDPTITAHIATDGFVWGFEAYHPDYYVDNPAFDWALGSLRPQLADYEERFVINSLTDAPNIRILQRRDKPVETK
ncbi:MAG: hypothetical protein R2911_06535 [Caldilineaceae bacterium]